MYKLKIRYRNKDQQEYVDISYYEREKEMREAAYLSKMVLKSADCEILQETQEKGEYKRTEKIWNYRKD